MHSVYVCYLIMFNCPLCIKVSHACPFAAQHLALHLLPGPFPAPNLCHKRHYTSVLLQILGGIVLLNLAFGVVFSGYQRCISEDLTKRSMHRKKGLDAAFLHLVGSESARGIDRSMWVDFSQNLDFADCSEETVLRCWSAVGLLGDAVMDKEQFRSAIDLLEEMESPISSAELVHSIPRWLQITGGGVLCFYAIHVFMEYLSNTPVQANILTFRSEVEVAFALFNLAELLCCAVLYSRRGTIKEMSRRTSSLQFAKPQYPTISFYLRVRANKLDFWLTTLSSLLLLMWFVREMDNVVFPQLLEASAFWQIRIWIFAKVLNHMHLLYLCKPLFRLKPFRLTLDTILQLMPVFKVFLSRSARLHVCIYGCVPHALHHPACAPHLITASRPSTACTPCSTRLAAAPCISLSLSL